jgi:hypothetical protein
VAEVRSDYQTPAFRRNRRQARRGMDSKKRNGTTRHMVTN